MPRYSANLSMLYTEHDFLDRFAAAAADGFTGVEYLGPYDVPEADVADALSSAGLTQVLFNLPSGDWAGGERGIAALPGREEEFRDGVGAALRYAQALGCRQINCLCGKLPEGVARAEAEEVLVANLAHAAPRLAEAGIRLLVEPINSFDIPGFLLTRPDETLALFDRVGADNLWLQYDLYHMQRMQGELMATFERLQPRIAHVQIADNPGRHEPGTGEINYGYVLPRLDALGYEGWVGCEYVPAAGTSAGLTWRNDI
ncbi:hydroxypyruvate isomerase [Celeribacter indicus]|uniref:Hydroxypyruvate isomerase n=1 Tax=Celeribacter indicus TaxID=1208324 RepID=A0A0B5E659_9RHOB|nr:hydroxypyruvate isomerase [Celeribacter indicus]AJE47817.1 hydroxypyruvate isomerase [Celeribacter indicus]SDW23864.1 hydroxypyruvate isomerase [Celeribacter indicus]